MIRCLLSVSHERMRLVTKQMISNEKQLNLLHTNIKSYTSLHKNKPPTCDKTQFILSKYLKPCVIVG